MLLVPSGTAIKTHRGRRLSAEDDFSYTVGDLNGNYGWVKHAGSGVIYTDGTRANTGNNNAVDYTQTGVGYNRNRFVKCDCLSLVSGASSGVYLTKNAKYYIRIAVYRSGLNDILSYSIGYGGIPIGGTIATLIFAARWRTITILRSGDNLVVTCSPGMANPWTYTLAGTPDNTDNDPPGLYYSGPAGPGLKARWDNFEARNCAYA
jgi:hypothetical protein